MSRYGEGKHLRMLSLNFQQDELLYSTAGQQVDDEEVMAYRLPLLGLNLVKTVRHSVVRYITVLVSNSHFASA